MIKLWFIGFIFTIAGVYHLLNPAAFIFLLPPWVPFQIPFIYATGILELLLVIGLISQRLRSLSGYISAIYLLILNFIHFYVAWEGIPMFGYNSPILLWGRFVVQFVLIFWAYRIGKCFRYKTSTNIK